MRNEAVIIIMWNLLLPLSSPYRDPFVPFSCLTEFKAAWDQLTNKNIMLNKYYLQKHASRGKKSLPDTTETISENALKLSFNGQVKCDVALSQR